MWVFISNKFQVSVNKEKILSCPNLVYIYFITSYNEKVHLNTYYPMSFNFFLYNYKFHFLLVFNN